MAIWKKAMDYLGLGPDDAYDDYDVPPEQDVRPTRAKTTREPEPQVRSVRPSPVESETDANVRPLPPRPTFPSREGDLTTRRPAPAPDESTVQPRPVAQPRVTVRSVGPASSDPHTVRPRRFDSAQEIADKFKEGQPVIVNLEGTDRDVSRRLIDFASGLCYALDGTMEKVASGVYLLKPAGSRPSFGDDFA